MKNVTFEVRGMTCGGCVSRLERALKAAPGVSDANVVLRDAKASITFDERATSEDALASAIEDAGFDVGSRAAG